MFTISKLKTILTVTAIIIALLILTSLICLKLAFTDDNTDKYYSTPDFEPVQTIAINTLLGNQSDITEENLNHIVAYLIEKANEAGVFSENCKLLAAYIDINTGRPCRCYFQVDYNGRKLGFSADMDINFTQNDSKINITFSNAKLGQLKIPKKIIINVLKKTKLSDATEYLSISDLAINLPTKFEVEIPKIGQFVPIEIQELQIYEDEIHIETNPILNDTLTGIRDTLLGLAKQYGIENPTDIINSLGGLIGKFLQ